MKLRHWKFNIFVTDWEKAQAKVEGFINEEHRKSSDKGRRLRCTTLFNQKIAFVSGNNPFPAEEAKKTQDRIRLEGLTGEYIRLDQTPTGIIIITQSV